MTYLFKIARRLARSWRIAVPLVLAAACSPTEERDFLSPNPGASTQLISVSVSPRLGSAKPGERIQFNATGVGTNGSMPIEVDWTATGGTIGADGAFVSDRLGFFQVAARVKSAPHLGDSVTVAVYQSPQDVVLVRVSPDTATVFEGEGLQLEAVARLGDGTTTGQAPLDWSATGGTVDGSGWYAAPTEGTYLIEARASSDISASSRITVRKNRMVNGIVVTPDGVTVPAGGTQQFSAQARYSDGGTGSVSVTWSATGGTIGGSGQFVAGSAAGNYRVIARAKSGGFADTAYISVAAPTIAGVEISPVDLSLAPTATQQYVATARMSDGTTQTVGATWRTTGGTISAGGLYTAPSTTGNYRVVGEVSGTSYADTSSVAVGTPEATLTQLLLNPSSASVPAGASRQFSVSGVYSDGSTRTPSVTWSATGGTISSGGLYVAGTAQGAWQVIATDAVSGRADTSVVTVGAPALTALVLSPAEFALQAGQSRQLSVAGTWSDGSTATPGVTWNATGGTVSGDGLFTAGSVAGTYRVIALEAGGLADTGYVTISQAEVALTSLAVSPGSTSVQAGGSRQFTVSGTYADGSTGNPAVTWSATGGTISPSGFYTASGSAGSFRVIATQSGGGLADTAEVTVTAPPSLVSLAITPGSVGLGAGQTQQFTVSGTYSNGSTGTPTVAWSATGGTITSSGLYTAGQYGGAFLVIASCGCGVADTATISLAAQAQPTLQAIELSPASVTLAPGASQAFQAVGRMSDGSSSSVPVTYSFTGGSMVGSTYTAGSIVGQYAVIARDANGTVADTSSVLVQSASTPQYTNEPAGFTRIAEADYSVKPGALGGTAQNQIAGYWWRSGNTSEEANLQAVQTSASPRSPSSVLDCKFPLGFVAGSEPCYWVGWNDPSLGESSTSITYRELYVSFWIRLAGSSFENQRTGTKLFYINYMNRGRMNHAILSLFNDLGYQTARTSWPLRWWSTVANSDGSDPGFAIGWDQNVNATKRIEANRWHQVEVYLKQNTVTATPTPDGIARVWIDGVKVIEVSNIKYTSALNPLGFHQYRGAMVYGGTGDVKTKEDHIQFDHLYISGAGPSR